MKRALLLLFMTVAWSAWAQKPNIAPNATVTADGTGGGGCRTGACSTLNDLNYGSCGTQQMWISTTSPPSSVIGADFIEWNWPITQAFDEMTIHHASATTRSLTGFLMQYWDGAQWVNGQTFSNLPQQCINTVTFQRIVASRMRITQFQMTGSGQTSNPNFREIEIFQASTSDNDAGVVSTNTVPAVCPGSYPVIVTIQNFGLNQIDSVNIDWEMNGVIQPGVIYANLLDTIGGQNPSSAQVVLGNYPFAPNTTYTLKAWTSLPNNAVDTANFNDTLEINVALGAPTGLAAGNLSSTTADISWTTITGTTYGIIYGPTGFNPDNAGTTVLPAASPYSITGLSPTNVYDVYLFADCGSSVYSDTAGPVTFATLIQGPQGVNCNSGTATTLLIEEFDNSTSFTGDISTSTGDWNFEDGTTGSGNTGPSGPKSGSHYIYFEGSGAGPASMVSPVVPLGNAVDSAELSFYMHAYGSDIGYLVIRASTVSATGPFTDTLFFYNQGQLQTSSNDPWQHVGVRLDQYVGQDIWLEFEADRNGSFSSDIAIDSLVIQACGTFCLPQISNINFSNITTDSASFALVIDTTASFQYEWGPCGFAQGTGTVLTGTTQARFGVLSPNTCYDVYIRKDCGGLQSPWTGPFSFTSACAPFAAPYTQDFDGTTEPAVDNCWTVINSTSSSSFVGTENFLSNSAPNSLELFNSGATTGDVMIVSPEFSDLDSTKQITFFVNDDDDASDLIIGTMSNREDANSFTPYDTITAAQMPDDTWFAFTVRFDNYSGTDGYIAFRHGMGTTSDNIYIDDFEYRVIPDCIPPTINSLGAANVTSASADLFWGVGSAGDTTFIEWGLPGFSPGTSINLGTGSVTGTVDTFQITGLSPLTTYEFYVRDSCAVDGFSPWIGPFSFTTPVQGPQGVTCTTGNPTVLLFEEFDGTTVFTGDISTSTGDWNYETNNTGSGNTGPTGPFSGSEYIYFEGSGAGPAEMISPPIDLSTAVNAAELAFWLHAYGANIGYLHVTASTSPTGPFNDTLFKLESQIQTSSNDPWQQVGIDLSSYLGQVVYINFTADREVCCSGDIAIDLLTVEACGNFCLPPINLGTTAVVDTAATLTWDTTSAGSYEIWFGPQGFFQGTQTTGAFRSTTTTNSFVVDTLTGQTCYEFLVRGFCGGDTSLWAGPFSFCTPCSPVTAPYFEDFDALSTGLTGDLGNCWISSPDNTTTYSWRTNSGTTGSGSTGPTGDATTGTGIYLYTEASSGSTGDLTFLESPLIDLSGISNAEMRYAYHLYGATIDSLVVEVNSGSGWQMVDWLVGQQQTSNGDPWRIDTVDLSAFSGIIQVRFRARRGSSFTGDISIDDFIVEQPVPTDLSLVSADFDKNTLCLSSNDTIMYHVRNLKGATYDLSTDPLVLHYDITGPVNSTGSATFSSGTIPPGDTSTFMITGADLSLAGSYSLEAWMDPNNFNLSPLNDSLDSPASITLREVWDVQPDTVVVVNSANDTVNMSVVSSLLGGLPDTSILTTPPLISNNGQSGITFEVEVSQPVDMIGLVNIFSTASTANLWMRLGGVQHATGQAPNISAANGWTQVVTNGTVIGANGTTPVPMDFGATSISLVPNQRYGFFIDGATDYQSGTAADQTTFSDGIITIIVDDDAAYGGGIPTPTFNPRRFLGGIIYEIPRGTAGFSWNLNGQLHDTLPNTFATGWAQSGVYNYIANYNSPCGVFTDTVTVVVNLPGACPTPTSLNANVITCDSVDLSWNDAADSALVWNVPTGTTPTGGGSLVIGDSSLNVTGTVANTRYDFYVANICGGDTSSVAGPFSYNTDSVGAPVASFTYTSSGFTLNFDASGTTGKGVTYSWDFGDGNQGAGMTAANTYASGGSYTITLTATNPCGSDDTSIVVTDVNLLENALSRSISMYPNPAKEEVNLSFRSQASATAEIRVTDISGKTVMVINEDHINGEYKAKLDISELADGIYMVEVTSGDMTAVRRLIKD